MMSEKEINCSQEGSDILIRDLWIMFFSRDYSHLTEEDLVLFNEVSKHPAARSLSGYHEEKQ